ncbi:MAG: tRNA (N6-threonylcarbamoyladenosine(37)-N6)-methyltransferase TrmO [Firmicutes bacterium]|nr:tRNA (N6-threonylcarbamoyladenosine(37)-N6)-methyltransferase TrmO [Bacillota bacterium]
MEINRIATIYTDFPGKFGLPRQAGLAPSLRGRIVMEKEFRRAEAFRGLEGFSHIWLIWGFSESAGQWQPTVRPPRLGGNVRVGVFASRSPFRPNGLGMSAVKLERIDYEAEDGPVLYVSGIDMVSGTPVYDIKPYAPHADCINGAEGGFAAAVADDYMEVAAPQKLLERLPEDKRRGLLEALAQDPAPHYQDDPKRIYGFEYAGFEIKFRRMENLLILEDITDRV